MSLNQDTPEKIEVTESVEKTGTVQFFNKAAVNNPAPEKMKRVLAGLKYFAVTLIGIVGATDIFTGGQAKIISFSLSVFIIALGALEYGTGVKPLEEK